VDEQMFQAAWPLTDPSALFDDLVIEGRRLLSAMLREQGLVALRGRGRTGSWRKTATHLTWIGPVRELRHRPTALLPADPLIAFADRVGITDGQSKVLERARRSGQVSRRVADRFCCHELGVHPCFVWGDDWWGDDLDLDLDLEEAS
jgi:hypothetical protein